MSATARQSPHRAHRQALTFPKCTVDAAAPRAPARLAAGMAVRKWLPALSRSIVDSFTIADIPSVARFVRRLDV